MAKQEFSKYERARIIGARGLQISMDAPLLIKVDESELNAMNFDPLKIAEKELDDGVLPISVSKPMPEKKESNIEAVKVDTEGPSDEEKEEEEEKIEKEMVETGAMAELDNSGEEDEMEFSEMDEGGDEGELE